LTVADVAAELHASRSTVWRLADCGALPRVRIGPAGRLVRFRAIDVERLVERAAEDRGSVNAEDPATIPGPQKVNGDDGAGDSERR
jgi:excisionase family DNA binding protein